VRGGADCSTRFGSEAGGISEVDCPLDLCTYVEDEFLAIGEGPGADADAEEDGAVAEVRVAVGTRGKSLYFFKRQKRK
jgi:hypothetical protein